MDLNILINKIKTGINLTEKEELFYMANALKISEKEAKRIINLSKFNKPGTLID